MGDLKQDSCTITRVLLTTAGTAVFHVFQHGEGITNNMVGFTTLDMSRKTCSAGIMFEFRTV